MNEIVHTKNNIAFKNPSLKVPLDLYNTKSNAQKILNK